MSEIRRDWLVKINLLQEDGTWSPFYGVQVGFDEQFVYDKTTDKANVNLIIRQEEEPTFEIGQWVNLAHFTAGESMVLTYDENGLPVNHNQYVIGAYEVTKGKIKNYWTVKLGLMEPIELMKGVPTELLDFKNQTSKTVVEEGQEVTYIKDAYTQLTALERVLKVTPANTDDFDNPSPNDISWYRRINILDSDFLNSQAFNDDTFSASDLYTVLFKFDDYVDRTPVLYFDLLETGEIANTSKRTYKLKFHRKDGYDKPELDYQELFARNIGFSKSKTIDNYATGVVSEVNNLTVGTGVAFPSINLWAVPQMDVETRTVPAGEETKGQWFLKLPFPIKRVIRLEKLAMTGLIFVDPPVYTVSLNRWIEERNPKYILEKQGYLASELIETDTEKNKLIWYEDGSDKLYINEYYLFDGSGHANLYYIEYEPLPNAKMQLGGGDYITSINQNDSQVESQKYSNFLTNYLESMNKADILLLLKYQHYEEFKDLVGSRVVNNETKEEYIITNCSYKNANFTAFVTIQLNKDHIRRNINVRANEQIKPNKNIEYGNLKDRRTIITDNISIDITSINNPAKFLTNKLLMLSALIPNQVASELCPELALITTKSKLQKNDSSFVDREQNFLLNIAKSINAKQIQYILKSEDNAIIGTSKQITGIEFNNVETQVPIIYTDPFGEIQKLDINFSTIGIERLGDYDGSSYTQEEKLEEYGRSLLVYETMANLPSINEEYKTDLENNSVFNINDINYYKNMLEVLNLSFVFNLTSANKNIIICQDLLILSRLIQSNDTHTLKIFGHSAKTKENDLLNENKLFELSATSEYDSNSITINFTAQSTENLKSLTITTNNDKKLLILNELGGIMDNISNGFVKIYF